MFWMGFWGIDVQIQRDYLQFLRRWLHFELNFTITAVTIITDFTDKRLSKIGSYSRVK